MNIENKLGLSVLALITVLGSGCSAASSSHDAVKTTATEVVEANNQYVKPGAAVSYSHNLKPLLKAGETVTFQLTLQESYNSGNLRVNLSTDENVQILGGVYNSSFDMATSNSHVLDISLTANNNGRHYINVQAMADDGSGQAMPRNFAIPVQVGALQKMKPHSNLTVTSDGEHIIVMDAEEEIIQ